MKCAIITCSEYKKKIFQKPYIITEISLPLIEEKILVFNLAYNSEKFYKLTAKKKKRLCEKLCAKLSEERTVCVYMAGITDCKEFYDIRYRFYNPDGKNILKSYAAVGGCVLAAQQEKPLNDVKICIWQKHFNHGGLEIVLKFTDYFKNITIMGENQDNLDRYVNKVMEITGMSIAADTNKSGVNGCDFLFLLDEFDGVGICENVTVIDLSKSSGFRCLNAAKFEMPQGFNCLVPYFGMFDDICIEFILRLTNEKIRNQKNIHKNVERLNGRFKSFVQMSKNNA